MDSVAPEASWRENSPPGNEAQEKYQCPRCPSSFKRPEHLKRHQRSHDGHKPFMCSICMKRFFRRYSSESFASLHSETDLH